MEKMALMTCLFPLSSPSKSQYKPAVCNEATVVSSHTDAGDKEDLESSMSEKQSSADALSNGSNVAAVSLLHEELL